MPGFMRAMAVFQGATNLPEDRFVNTFHAEWFGAGASYETIAPIFAASIETFYTVSQSNGRALRQLMSPFISGLSISTYNMDLPKGEREPTTIEAAWVDTSVTPNLPEECAVCLTLTGPPPVTPRRRGRLYFGPLVSDSDVLDYANDDAPTRVNITGAQSVGKTLQLAAGVLLSSETFHWCIRSVTPDVNYVPIAGGWIDNAFDIQRRRGPDADARLMWP